MKLIRWLFLCHRYNNNNNNNNNSSNNNSNNNNKVFLSPGNRSSQEKCPCSKSKAFFASRELIQKLPVFTNSSFLLSVASLVRETFVRKTTFLEIQSWFLKHQYNYRSFYWPAMQYGVFWAQAIEQTTEWITDLNRLNLSWLFAFRLKAILSNDPTTPNKILLASKLTQGWV